MTPTKEGIPHHNEIDPRYTWNATSVFPTVEAWEAEVERLPAIWPVCSSTSLIWRMARQPWPMPWILSRS